MYMYYLKDNVDAPRAKLSSCSLVRRIDYMEYRLGIEKE